MKSIKLPTATATAFLLFLAIVVSGCADVEHVEKCVSGHTYGFWGGVWHGWITPISFVGSLFSDDIAVYAVNNNGGWYDFGFVFGIGGIVTLLEMVFGIIKAILK